MPFFNPQAQVVGMETDRRGVIDDDVVDAGVRPRVDDEGDDGADGVPVMLQDPVTLMLHFILSLPINIEKGEFLR